ncbi:MAG: hypothetical protein AABY85_12150, partial [Gemmatimonadota bacterium]
MRRSSSKGLARRSWASGCATSRPSYWEKDGRRASFVEIGPSRRHVKKLIGKIVLARFLERTPASVLAAARQAEEVARRAGLFDGAAPALRRKLLPGASHPLAPGPDRVFARVQVKKGKPVLVWRSVYFGCEYTVDGQRLSAWLAQTEDESSEVLRAVRTLLLVSTRNRIAHEVARVLFRAQRDFLRTGSEARLVVLTQRQVVREAQARLAAADASRVSRLLRSTVVL